MIGMLSRSRLWVFALVITLCGCADTPQERLTEAWTAAEAEQYDRFVSYFTEGSVPLLRGITEAMTRTKKAFTYVDSIYDLVPAGDIIAFEERDKLALVTIKAKERYTVRLLFENGAWSIDGTSLPGIWEPLQEEGDG